MAELEIKPALGMRLRVLGLIGVAVVLSATLMYLLVGGGQDLFALHSTLVTYIPDADGLIPDNDVRLRGFQIGEVQSVDISGLLDPNRAVRVRMEILTRYLKSIPRDSQTSIGSDTMVGDRFIEIAQGKSSVPIEADGVLQSEPVAQATNNADFIKALQEDLSQIDQILADMLSPKTDLGEFIVGEQEYDTLLAHIGGFNRDLHAIIAPQSSLGQAFYSSEIYDGIHNLVLRLDKDLTSIRNGEGTAGHLFASDDQYKEMLSGATSLRTSLADTNAGKGKLGAILQEDAAWRRIEKALSDMDAAISSMNAGEGKAGRLLANAQVYESLNGSLRQLDALLRDIREHPKNYTRFKR
jgi:phospholipid/cholesterol/gamma-HCH transport system substrate-binding protein